MYMKKLGLGAALLIGSFLASSPASAEEAAMVSAGNTAELSCNSGDTMVDSAETGAAHVLRAYCQKPNGSKYRKEANCTANTPTGNGVFRNIVTNNASNKATAVCARF